MLNLNKLSSLPFFNLDSAAAQTEVNPLPYIKYHLKTGKIVGLKRGVYVAGDYLKKVRYQGRAGEYAEFLATQLVQPAYISLEYALAGYSVLTESAYAVTCVTAKLPRRFHNPVGNFSYCHIKPLLFTGYKLVQKGDFVIPYASRAKAIFDFLYFKKRSWRSLNRKTIGELRLNLEELRPADWQELKQYIKISRSNKITKIFKFLSPKNL